MWQPFLINPFVPDVRFSSGSAPPRIALHIPGPSAATRAFLRNLRRANSHYQDKAATGIAL
jgi:hypothetical protein